MKICSIRIKNFQQFEDTYFDFTDPKTGEPLDKICFIGSNGTGKSTILKILNTFLSRFISKENAFAHPAEDIPFLLIKFSAENEHYYFFSSNKFNPKYFFYHGTVDTSPSWNQFLISYLDRFNFIETHKSLDAYLVQNLDTIMFKNFENDLIIYSPAETVSNSYANVYDVPTTSVNEALELFNRKPFVNLVSNNNVNDFWKLMVYHIKKREAEQQDFENKPGNLSKTKLQLLEEFEKINPKILDHISILWNKILEKVGLEFDVENASKPIHLNDNLKAYIKIKDSEKRINYNELSTGIRNYIFRLGHILSLYFNRSIENGFLLVDEPENSLFPDFIYDLLEIYSSIILDKEGNNNTQIFMATHNPILAAQFEANERIILEWGESGFVVASKGKTPVGDDPNDILKNDFGIRNLMGKEGIAKWEEYLKLKKELRRSNGSTNNNELVNKITEIGSAYNFE